jgi:hypothetical protein
VVEPADQVRESARDDSARRGGRRRRRGGRDRNRSPDIAADGGEMLDAIASAPFLIGAVQMDAEEVSHEAADLTPPSPYESPVAAATPGPALEILQDEPGTPQRGQQEPQPAQSYEPKTAPEDDHEIAARAVEAPFVEPAHEEPRVEPEPAETRRHPIHGAPDEPETPAESAPRKMGWWNRRRTG